MEHTPENCEKVARQIVEKMFLLDLREMAIYLLGREFNKREDLFDKHVKSLEG